jgi:peptide/nickel transport system substrate-binding protein
MKMLRKAVVVATLLAFVGLSAAGCATPTPEVIEKVITKEVEKVVTEVVEVEKEVTKIVAGTPVVEKVVETKVVEKEVTRIVEVEPTKHGGTLTVGLSAQPSTLNPYGGISGMSGQVLKQAVETLVQLDKETLKPKPLLATSWEIPDEQTYVFTLREGVKFHDGTDFDAEAVKFVFDYILNPDNASPAASYFDRVESVEVVDDYKVTFHLTEPFAVLLANLDSRGYIMSPTYLQKATPEELDVAPVGTGPFKIVEWVRDDKVVLERFEDYWDGDLPYLDEIVYKITPDPTAKMVALRTGELDIIGTVPATEIEAIKEDEDLVFVEFESTGYRSIYLNCAAPPFNDARLRQVLAWAIDRGELIRLGTLGIGKPAFGPLAPPQWAFDSNFRPYMRDLSKAKELLAEAGVPDGFSFTIKARSSPEEVRVVEVLQQQLAEAGIEMDIVTGEYTAIRSTVIAGDYEAFYVGWLGGADPDSNMWNSFHSDGWFNWVNYSNPEVDRLLDEARATSDIEQRTELYRQAQEIISDEAPMVFLKFPYYAADGQARRTHVVDFVPGPGQTMEFKRVWLAPQ